MTSSSIKIINIMDPVKTTTLGDGPNYEDLSIAAILDLFPRPPQTINTTGASTTQFQSQQSLSTPVNQTGRRSSRSSSISIAVENPSQPQHQQQITTPLQSRFAASAATTNTVQIAPVSVSLGTLPGRSSGSLSPANPLSSSTNNMGAATVSADGQFLDPDRFSYSLAPGIAEMDYIDLLKRACRGIIAPIERESLRQFLLCQPPSKVLQLQRAIHQLLVEKPLRASNKSLMSSLGQSLAGKPQNFPAVEPSKYYLDFQLKGRQAKLNEVLNDKITIEGKSGPRIQFALQLPRSGGSYELSVDPLAGRLKFKETVEIRITLRIKRPLKLSEIICIAVEGGFQHFIAVSVSSEPSEFGLPINESELMDDIIMGRKHCGVPKTLYQLRQMFLQRNGLNVEEIFRRQIDEENLVLLRRQFDQRQSLDQLTAEQLSMLIKLWFRELPDRLFDDAAVGESKPINQLILECDSEEKALQIYNNPELCRPACRQVLDWILDLLYEVVQNRDQNRMTSKKIAIVMAPNLLPSQPEQLNAELMRKKADFINYLLSTRGTK